MVPTDSIPARRRTIPAWALSALLHLAIMVALPLLFGSVNRTLRQEPDRPVSLVLARAAESRVEYYSQDAQPADQDSGSPSETVAAIALPALDSSSTLSRDIALPAAIDTNLAGSQLVETPRLTVSGGARIPGGIDASAILADEEARRRAVAARGPTTRLALFGGMAAEGRSFVFLIDRSQSMGNQGLRALAAAEQELVRALDALQPKHEFQVIAYHHKCVYLQSRELLKATDENKQAVKGHLSGLAAFGATEHERALMSALYLKPDVIFLLTDGGTPHLDESQLSRIRKLAAGRTTIHCIQFGLGPLQQENQFMHRLAAQNGGGYGYVDMAQ